MIDQVSANSNYQGQESNISNDTDDMSVGDINEITFSVLIDDNDDMEDEEDDDEDEGGNYDDEEGEQYESDEEKRVGFSMLIERHIEF